MRKEGALLGLLLLMGFLVPNATTTLADDIGAATESPTFEYRSINGSGNNIDNPSWGMAGIPLLRVSGNEYGDGISVPAGASRNSPREISNIVVAQNASIVNSARASDFIWQWGQFLDHDLDLTPVKPNETFNIPVPIGDPFFDPNGTGSQVIFLNRSVHVGGNGSDPREQINVLTAFIDASNVYGSDTARAMQLRTLSGGKMNTSEGNLLPLDGSGFFIAGDTRVNEQIALTAMHTLFVREHNRLADELAVKFPGSSDEEIYQMTRKIVGAQMQIITYKEFLPLLLGNNTIPAYAGYDPNVDPGVANEFSAAGFRVGHTLLSPNILRVTNSGDKVFLPLRNAFNNPGLINVDDGIDSILRGLASQKAQEVDSMMVDDVRNFLFGPPGSGGFDLASLNMQRGRDHGLPDYNAVRVAYNLTAVSDFDDISSNPIVQNKLASAYDSVNDIDLWMGIISEDHVPGAMVGETLVVILVDQFTRVRDGDRFWYENDPFFADHMDIKADVENTQLSDIIKRNTNVGDELRENVFKLPKGDANGDGVVNILDMIRIARHILVIKPMDSLDQESADVFPAPRELGMVDPNKCGDGELDMDDLMTVAQAIVTGIAEEMLSVRCQD
jgi:hypothetical protein